MIDLDPKTVTPPPPDEIMAAVWWGTTSRSYRVDDGTKWGTYETVPIPQEEWTTKSEIWSDPGSLKRSMAARADYRGGFKTATYYILLGNQWYQVSLEELKHYKGKSLANAIRRREGLDERP